MRLIVLGTGPFAVPTFQSIASSNNQITLLVTRPTRLLHDRRKQPVNPMLEEAKVLKIPVWEPESVNTPSARKRLAALQADLMIVSDFGEILSGETLAVARHGGINLHGSLLPKYRGAAPIPWAIFHGEQETGVSVIQMTSGLDAGPILGQSKTAIQAEETSPQLERRLAKIGAVLIGQILKDIRQLRTQPSEQNTSLASTARRLKKSDGLVDWSFPPKQIQNQVRAMQPWPKTYTFWHRNGGRRLRLILDKVAPCSNWVAPAAASGTVVSLKPRLTIATGCGMLNILRLQPEGKRVLTAKDFLHGYPVQTGDRFGP